MQKLILTSGFCLLYSQCHKDLESKVRLQTEVSTSVRNIFHQNVNRTSTELKLVIGLTSE